MRHRRLPVLLVALGIVTSAACATIHAAPIDDASEQDAGSDAPDSSEVAIPPSAAFSNDDASMDASPRRDAGRAYPLAVGDPCRGVPLPDGQHYSARGTCARVVASGIFGIRQLSFAPNGDLFAVSASGTVYLLRDANDDGTYEGAEIHEWSATGGNGNNCHVDAAGGYVYAGSPNGVVRWPYDPLADKAAAPPEDVVVGQPSDGHPLHTVHVYGTYLYVHAGSLGDDGLSKGAAYDDERSLLRRYDLTKLGNVPFPWLSGEVVTVGLRNMVGYTQHASGRMYGVVNGMDAVSTHGQVVSEDNPGEQVVELGLGKAYGFPFCFTAQRVVQDGGVVSPGTQLARDNNGYHDDAWCAAHSQAPATFVQAHSAPLDILFFDEQPEGALPEAWRGGAFVTLHGSHVRSTSTGYKVIWIPFDAAGRAPMPVSTETTTTFPYETVFGGGTAAGPIDGEWKWTGDGGERAPRPVGIAISPIDGALYVSSDSGDAIYRVGLPR